MYDLLVFIGRFQPLHKGHQEVIERASGLSKRVAILVGSSNCARSTRNPLTYDERKNLISFLYPRAIVRPIGDHTYNDTAWVAEVQQTVKDILLPKGKWTANGLKDFKIGLIGCEKDHTSFYLKLFPDWGNENVHFLNPLCATNIRKMIFEKNFERHIMGSEVDVKVIDWINDFWIGSEDFNQLQYQFEYENSSKKTYGEGPHLTADSLVQVGGKILLIKRGKEYGHGLYALPGGFVERNETFRECALRELREETNLRVPVPVLRGSITHSRTYDAPHRSQRGRLVTQCFRMLLANDTSLPEVRGGDDAEHADWYDIGWIMENPKLFFEDHYGIIEDMLGTNARTS